MIHRVFEQLGLASSMKSSGEYVTLAGRLPSNQEFKRIAREHGLRAAVKWRDEPFGGTLGRYPPLDTPAPVK